LSETHIPLCTVPGCPAPSDPDWHVPWCGHGLEGHHHHVPKRSQGGKRIVAFLCPKCHDAVDNGFKYGNAVYIDGEGREVYRLWEVTLESPGKTLIERVIGQPAAISGTEAPLAPPYTGTEAALEPLDATPEPPPAPRETAPAVVAPMLTDLGIVPDVGPEIVRYARRALIIEGTLSWERYKEVCHTLRAMHDCMGFWVGDAILAGEAEFGERCYQPWSEDHVDEDGNVVPAIPIPTLLRYVWVCSRVGVSARKAELSFTIHQTVAALPPGEQAEWLTRAQEEGMSSRQLREYVTTRREPCEHVWTAMRVPPASCPYCLKLPDGPMLVMGTYWAHVACVITELRRLLDPDWEPGRKPAPLSLCALCGKVGEV
jgi:hypothetical protein